MKHPSALRLSALVVSPVKTLPFIPESEKETYGFIIFGTIEIKFEFNGFPNSLHYLDFGLTFNRFRLIIKPDLCCFKNIFELND